MAFNIQQFRSNLLYDGARPNLFEVTMAFPAFANIENASNKLSFMCKSAQLPGSTINPVPVYYFGRELKFAGNPTYPDWTITVINDEDFIVKNVMEKWHEGINSHQLNVRNPAALSSLGYTVDATVRQYGKTGNIIKQYKFIGMFPNDVSPIEVDWGANDTIEEFTVNFSYQWWSSEEIGI